MLGGSNSSICEGQKLFCNRRTKIGYVTSYKRGRGELQMASNPPAVLPALLILHLAVLVAWCTSAAADGTSDRQHDVGAFWCPRICRCRESQRVIDCSSLGLDHLPFVHESTTRL